MSFSGCFGPRISTDIMINIHFMQSHGGRLYMQRITGQVLWPLFISPKGFMSSVLKPNLMFLASKSNSGYVLSIFSPLWPISGVSQHRVFLAFLFVPSHQLSIPFICKQTLKMCYYRRVLHNLGRNSLLGMLLLDVLRIIFSDLVTQCIAYRACIQILILITSVEDAVIGTCMYLLYLQS